jgi:hypothetical protein
MTELLYRVLVVGLAAGGLASITVALPWPKAWLARKPLGCPTCMAGHASWVVLLGVVLTLHWGWSLGSLALTYFGALCVALWFHRQVMPVDLPL